MIAGTAEFLLGEFSVDDPRRADMEVISQEGHRVADLVRRLLGLVRERSELPGPVDMHDLLDHTLRLLEYRFQQVHITGAQALYAQRAAGGRGTTGGGTSLA